MTESVLRILRAAFVATKETTLRFLIMRFGSNQRSGAIFKLSKVDHLIGCMRHKNALAMVHIV